MESWLYYKQIRFWGFIRISKDSRFMKNWSRCLIVSAKNTHEPITTSKRGGFLKYLSYVDVTLPLYQVQISWKSVNAGGCNHEIDRRTNTHKDEMLNAQVERDSLLARYLGNKYWVNNDVESCCRVSEVSRMTGWAHLNARSWLLVIARLWWILMGSSQWVGQGLASIWAAFINVVDYLTWWITRLTAILSITSSACL